MTLGAFMRNVGSNSTAATNIIKEVALNKSSVIWRLIYKIHKHYNYI